MQTWMLDLFISLALTCAMGVILSTNSIYSVIFLILVFFNATGLLLVLTPKVEFIAIMFLIIYVGAIAVLFLFVVMMLKLYSFSGSFSRLLALSLVALSLNIVDLSSFEATPPTIYNFPSISGAYALGLVLYSPPYFIYFFILAGLILLVAMIGAIVLAPPFSRCASKKQFIFEQVTRSFEKAINWAT